MSRKKGEDTVQISLKLTTKQKQWLDENSVGYTKFLRKLIDEAIEKKEGK